MNRVSYCSCCKFQQIAVRTDFNQSRSPFILGDAIPCCIKIDKRCLFVLLSPDDRGFLRLLLPPSLKRRFRSRSFTACVPFINCSNLLGRFGFPRSLEKRGSIIGEPRLDCRFLCFSR